MKVQASMHACVYSVFGISALLFEGISPRVLKRADQYFDCLNKKNNAKIGRKVSEIWKKTKQFFIQISQ